MYLPNRDLVTRKIKNTLSNKDLAISKENSKSFDKEIKIQKSLDQKTFNK